MYVAAWLFRGQIAGMPYRIRDIVERDLPHLPEIFRAAIEVTARHHYTDEQIRAWQEKTPSVARFTEVLSDGRRGFVVADENSRPLGFADLEPDGHIHWFYCDPTLSGTGMADRLLASLEYAAREQGVARLYVEASETARGLFQRNGFQAERRNDLEIGGVAIHNYAMSKLLR